MELKEIAPLRLDNDSKTNWKAVIIAGTICFLTAVEATFVLMADWPYMNKIDPHATTQFYGFSSSMSTTAHVLSSIIFSFWTYRTHTIRPQIILGRVLAFTGCCIYLCVEFLPSNRRYLMLICYIIFAVASSSSVVMRVYLVLVSSELDRSRAFAAVGVAGTTSIVIGPVGQLLFSWLSYPGIEVFPKVYFHLYSAPVWMATVTNIITLIFVLFFLEEMPKRAEKSEEPKFEYSLRALREKWKQMRQLDVSWSLVLLCLIERVIADFSPTTIGIIFSPLMMASFGWDNEYMVFQSSILLAIVGILSISVGAIFMGTRITSIIPSRLCLLISLITALAMYAISYPWNFPGSSPLPIYNETTQAGCNPKEYSWCYSTVSTHPLLFLPVLLAVMGIGTTMADISIDSIYSKILGETDQSLMQGLVVVVVDIAMIIEPIYSTTIFTYRGQSLLWKCNALITLIGLLLWLKNYRRLRPYN